MKFGFIGSESWIDPLNPGGMETIVRRFSNTLSKKFEVYILLFNSGEDSVDVNSLKNVVVVRRKSLRDLLRYTKDIKFNYLWFNEDTLKSLFIFPYLLKEKILGCKLIHPFHTYPPRIVGNMLSGKLYKIYTSFFDIKISFSYRINVYLSRFGIKSQTLVPPISEVFFTKNKNEIKCRVKKIGYFGRFSLDKGSDVVSKVLRQLSSRKDCKVLIKSYVNKNGYIRDFGGKIHKRKRLKDPDSEAIKFLDSIDILILPYKDLKYTVDSPLILLEAISRGVIPLVSGIGDIPEIILDDDFILNSPYDSDEIIKKIDNIFDNLKKKKSCLREIIKRNNLRNSNYKILEVL